MKLWSELRRRNVLRMAALYLVTSWLILQVTEVLSGLIDVPGWVGPLVLAMLVLGLPIVLVISWFFEITDSGVTRDPADAKAGPAGSLTGRRFDFIIISILAAALLVFAWLTWWPETPVEKSIAVMAFENMSDDPAQEYFSNGISEEILGMLAQSPGLRVVSRSSSFSFKGKHLDLPTIARQLDVAHILEGSVRKAGNQVRISAQLIEARTDSHLWSNTYERELTAANVFEIQTQIANSIADALNPLLTTGNEAESRRAPTRSLPALEAYLLGKQHMARRSRRSLTRAAEYFRQALDIDQEYASAWLGLADANLLLNSYGHIGLDDALRVAEPAIEKTLQLDDKLGAAYASLGLIRSLKGNIEGAAAALSRAVAMDPNEAKAYHWYGDILINGLGDPDAAIPMLQRARLLDPLSPVIVVTLGEAYSATGNLAEGLRLYRKSLEIDPAYLAGFRLLGMAYLSLADYEQARFWLDEGVRRGPDEVDVLVGKAFLYRALQDEENAVAIARRMQAMAPGNNTSLVTLVSFGHDQEAIDMGKADWPGLSCEDGPRVLRNNVFQAMNLSLAYERTGQGDCSHAILDAILALMEERGINPRAFGFLEAEIYARQEHFQRALATLRASVESGMRAQWMIQVEHSPHMKELRNHPDFYVIRDVVHEDLAQQLAAVRELEQQGVIGPLAD
ncbi:MAG TPA: tetratricopeptide repeat protein [Woeseiaceae bacterium]|nr:tetratricopeptide repeat protein [Woeseiaceae bacterium]